MRISNDAAWEFSISLVFNFEQLPNSYKIITQIIKANTIS